MVMLGDRVDLTRNDPIARVPASEWIISYGDDIETL